MVDDIFPKKPYEDSEFSDREWETYCINVWCCNSLNAQEGRCRRLGLYDVAKYLRRAQEVIGFLLRETGRMDD